MEEADESETKNLSTTDKLNKKKASKKQKALKKKKAARIAAKKGLKGPRLQPKPSAQQRAWYFTKAHLATYLRLRPNAADWSEARSIHRQFKSKPGSDHIASEFALAHLSALLRRHGPEITSVVEIGSGIGTITYLLVSRLPESTRIVCTEHNSFCLQQLECNLPSWMLNRISLQRQKNPRIVGECDLAIIDGKLWPPLDYLRAGTICFAEGSRTDSQAIINADLKSRGIYLGMKWYPAGFTLIWHRNELTKFLPTKGCWIGTVRKLSR
jgi:hypothetical protein